MTISPFTVYAARFGADLRLTAKIPFDTHFRDDVKSIAGARFHGEYGQWSVPKDAREAFSAVVAAAKARRESRSADAFRQMTRAQKAAWFDGLNEHGGGFNPYR